MRKKTAIPYPIYGRTKKYQCESVGRFVHCAEFSLFIVLLSKNRQKMYLNIKNVNKNHKILKYFGICSGKMAYRLN
jgi:hypothetical protein